MPTSGRYLSNALQTTLVGGLRKIPRLAILLLAAILLHVDAAVGADLTGVVTSRRGLPLVHVKVIVKDARGKVISTVYTDKNGIYRVSGLTPAVYTYTVDGGPVGFRGGNETIAHLPPTGLNIDWTMTSGAALATASTDPSAFQLGTDNASSFFSGMTGPVGGNSNAGSNTDPTGGSAANPSGGTGVPGGPSGVVGGVPVGAVLVPIAKNQPTPTPPVSPSR